VRRESHCGYRALPPRREVRWLDLRLSLGCSAKAPSDQHGRSGVMAAIAHKTKSNCANTSAEAGSATSSAAI
jgi:hypothetical protein